MGTGMRMGQTLGTLLAIHLAEGRRVRVAARPSGSPAVGASLCGGAGPWRRMFPRGVRGPRPWVEAG